MDARLTRVALLVSACLLSAGCVGIDTPASDAAATPTASTSESPREHIVLVLDHLDTFYDHVEALAPVIQDTTAMTERAALSAEAMTLVGELRSEFDWLPIVDIPQSVKQPYFDLLDSQTVFANLLGYEQRTAWDSGWHVINMQVPDLRQRVVRVRALAEELP